MRSFLAFVWLVLAGCGGGDAGASLPPADTTLVVASDPELRAMATEMLPLLADRSGLELRAPVRIERRSRAELERYLATRLDEELPEERARRITRSYHLLGLAPDDLRLRELLAAVYLEQVAGFYDPDSTALFVLDDQPDELVRPLLLHELVHAVQDQTVRLDSLTDPSRDNDRRKAAHAAIEGHATLVMMELLNADARGRVPDVTQLPGFGEQLRPALDGAREQYPVLASAPAIISESLLFPYLEGASFMLELWRSGVERGAAFRGLLPESTEQVLEPSRLIGPEKDGPTDVLLGVDEGEALYTDVLGRSEVDLLLRELIGSDAPEARGWDGDRFVLVAPARGGATHLVWASVWDSVAERDAFVAALDGVLHRFPLPSRLEAIEVDQRPVVLLRVGHEGGVSVELQGGQE